MKIKIINHDGNIKFEYDCELPVLPNIGEEVEFYADEFKKFGIINMKRLEVIKRVFRESYVILYVRGIFSSSHELSK